MHEDSMTWKNFLHYWPFVWGIHWSLDFPHKGLVIQSFDVSFVLSLNKLLNKQSGCCGFETPWHLYDVTVKSVKSIIVHWANLAVLPMCRQSTVTLNYLGCSPAVETKYKTLTDIVRYEQDGQHSADNILKYIYLKENCWILIKNSTKFALFWEV